MKKFSLLLVAFLTMLGWSASAQTYNLEVKNQRQDGSDFYFDVYLSSTNGGEFHLGDADVVLTFDNTKFTSPVMSVVASTSTLVNQGSTPTAVGNMSTSISGNELRIAITGPTSISSLATDVPYISTTAYRLSTFKVTNVTAFTSVSAMALKTSGSNPKTKILYYTSTTKQSKNGATEGTITMPTPVAAPSAITVASATVLSSSSMKLTWTNTGSGVLVVAKESAAPATGLANGVTYTADSSFSGGDNIGSTSDNAYVVYNGTGTSVNVSGLTAGATYYFEVYAYNGANGSTEGYASAKEVIKVSFAAEPTVAATNLTFSTVATTSYTASWTSGDGDYTLVLIRESSTAHVDPVDGTDYTSLDNLAFNNSNEISASTGVYVLYAGANSTTSASITGLTSETEYTVEVYTYNMSAGAASENYLVSAYLSGDQFTMFNEPTTALAAITFTQDKNSMDVNWTNPSEAANNFLIVARLNTASATAPTAGTAYTANTVFGSGDEIGTGNYVVYVGDGTAGTVAITGLTQNENYTFDVYAFRGEFTGPDSKTYNYANSANVSTSENTFLGANITAFLEGAYNGTDMDATGYTIPTTSPYSSGTTASSVPATAVDWVEVELRETGANTVAVANRSAFLLEDGSIVDVDGTSAVTFAIPSTGDYYVVVKHRTHLAVMSSATLTTGVADASFDFTTGNTQAFGTNAQNLDGSVYVMPVGDSNGDGVINATDIAAVWADRFTAPAYGLSSSDVNNDGYVDASDRAATWSNNTKTTQVP